MRKQQVEHSSCSGDSFDSQSDHIADSLGASKVQKGMLHSEHKVLTDALHGGNQNKSNTHQKEHPANSNTYFNNFEGNQMLKDLLRAKQIPDWGHD
jgi:hypothetical protein